MLSVTLSFLLFVSYVSGAVLVPRASATPTCLGLSAKSNNGNRKVAIVIDSSGSMADSDPYNLRLDAGRALNNWLITRAEAPGGKKADLVTVIDFDDTPHLDYALGDPAGANSSFDGIGHNGGTYIAGGVDLAISQLTQSGSGDTAGRSSIIVFTDGQDTDTVILVNKINRASALGIRVSFGFLDVSAENGDQDPTVLAAISQSGGVYATITDEDASNNFINFAIINGLTRNDNPQGNNSTLLAGLSIVDTISGSETRTVTYNAQAHENVVFSIKSIDAGILTAKALFGGKVKNTTSTSYYGGESDLYVQAPGAGQIEIKVTAQRAPRGSTYIVGATSDLPIQNCTLSVGGGKSGLSAGGKAGLGIGIPLLVAGLAAGCFFLWKYFKPQLPTLKQPPPPPHMQEPDNPAYYGEKPLIAPQISPVGPPSSAPPPVHRKPVPPSDNRLEPDSSHTPHKFRFKRFKGSDEERHHHHLPPEHPCNDERCPLVHSQHVCKDPDVDPKGPCACTDQNCPLNDQDHESDKHNPPCECIDEKCPINEEKAKKKRGQFATGIAGAAAKMGLGHVVSGMGS